MKKTLLLLPFLFTCCVMIRAQGAAGAGVTVAGVGAPADQLFNPTAVYIDGAGAIYVCDAVNSRIQKFPAGSSNASNGVTIAGGNGNGPAANQLIQPYGMYIDKSGNLYVADRYNNRVQKFPPGSTSATNGVTVAGDDTAGATASALRGPRDVYVDTSGAIYVADAGNNRIQKFPPGSTSGTSAVTVAGGNGSGAASNQLSTPLGVYLDRSSNVYVADFYNHRIQMFPAGSTTTTPGITVAGDGTPGIGANQLQYPTRIIVDSSGAITVADYYNNRVQRFPPGSRADTDAVTIAGGNGQGNGANQLNHPTGVYIDSVGNLYVADQANNRIKRYPAGSTSTTYGQTIAGGNGADWRPDQFDRTGGIAFDAAGYMYVSDIYNNRVQRFPPGSTDTTAGVTVAGGNGFGNAANQLSYPNGLFVDAATGDLYVADQLSNRIQKFPAGSTSATNGITVAGQFAAGNAGNQLNYPTSVYLDGSGYLYVADQSNNRVQRFPPGSDSTTFGVTVAAVGLILPRSVYVDTTGTMYVTNTNGHSVVKYNTGSTAATPGTIVAGGNGLGDAADQLSYPTALWFDKDGAMYVADNNNARIQKYPAGSDSTTQAVTVAGGNAPGNAANQLDNPLGVYVNSTGDIYIADDANNRVQKWGQPTGINTITAMSAVHIAPNPVHDRLTISASSSQSATISDMTGRVVLSMMIDGPLTVDTHQWAAGVYICTVRSGGEVCSRKVVKE